VADASYHAVALVILGYGMLGYGETDAPEELQRNF